MEIKIKKKLRKMELIYNKEMEETDEAIHNVEVYLQIINDYPTWSRVLLIFLSATLSILLTMGIFFSIWTLIINIIIFGFLLKFINDHFFQLKNYIREKKIQIPKNIKRMNLMKKEIRNVKKKAKTIEKLVLEEKKIVIMKEKARKEKLFKLEQARKERLFKLEQARKKRMENAKRIGLTPMQREAVFERDDYTCQHCFKTINEIKLEVDHILPVSKGGKNALSNLQTLCRTCNRTKSNKGVIHNVNFKEDSIEGEVMKEALLNENHIKEDISEVELLDEEDISEIEKEPPWWETVPRCIHCGKPYPQKQCANCGRRQPQSYEDEEELSREKEFYYQEINQHGPEY